MSRLPLSHRALTLALSIEAPFIWFPGWALLLRHVVIFLVNELKEKICLPAGLSGWLFAQTDNIHQLSDSEALNI